MSPTRGLLFSFFMALLAGCAAEADLGNTSDSPETEIRVGAKRSVSGLRLGKYAASAPESGELAALTLESRTSRTPRDYDGVWSGMIKEGGRLRVVSGGFTVVRKRVPMPSQASGHSTTHVVKLFDESRALLHEASFAHVGRALALYDWKTEREQLLDAVEDAAGRRPLALDCRLTTLHDDGVFEEGLSMDEYPDIAIEEFEGKLEVSIGASLYDQADGDTIVMTRREGQDLELAIELGGGDAYRVEVEGKKGVIEAVSGGARSRVAEFACR